MITTTPTLWLLCLWVQYNYSCDDDCNLYEPSSSLGHSVVLPPPLIPRDTMRGAARVATVPQQQQLHSKMPSQAYASYGIGPPQMGFLFQRCVFHWFNYAKVCYGVCFLFLGSHVVAPFTNGGSTIGVCNTETLQSIPMAGICVSWCRSVANARSALSGCCFHYFV